MAGNAASFLIPQRDDGHMLHFKQAAMIAVGLGLAGVDDISDTAAHAGDWWCMHALTDCVISTIGYAPGLHTGSKNGATILAGDRIYGPIKSITLTSGSAELYRASISQG